MKKTLSIDQVFKMLGNKEITVDEADELLKEINKKPWWKHVIIALFG